MKLFARPKGFSEAVASVTIISCILGLRVFEYPRGRLRPKLSLVYFLLIYAIYFNGSLRLEEVYYANVKLMKLEYVLYKLLTYIIVTSIIVKMFLGWWYTKVSEQNNAPQFVKFITYEIHWYTSQFFSVDKFYLFIYLIFIL